MIAQATGGELALQIAVLVTGGGIVQLLVYLLRRKTEIVALDKTASAPLLASANELIARLEVAEQKMTARVQALEEQLADSQGALRLSQEGEQKLIREVAQLRTDLDICRGQVDQLRLLLPPIQNTQYRPPMT